MKDFIIPYTSIESFEGKEILVCFGVLAVYDEEKKEITISLMEKDGKVHKVYMCDDIILLPNSLDIKLEHLEIPEDEIRVKALGCLGLYGVDGIEFKFNLQEGRLVSNYYFDGEEDKLRLKSKYKLKYPDFPTLSIGSDFLGKLGIDIEED